MQAVAHIAPISARIRRIQLPEAAASPQGSVIFLVSVLAPALMAAIVMAAVSVLILIVASPFTCRRIPHGVLVAADGRTGRAAYGAAHDGAIAPPDSLADGSTGAATQGSAQNGVGIAPVCGTAGQQQRQD